MFCFYFQQLKGKKAIVSSC